MEVSWALATCIDLALLILVEATISHSNGWTSSTEVATYYYPSPNGNQSEARVKLPFGASSSLALAHTAMYLRPLVAVPEVRTIYQYLREPAAHTQFHYMA